MGERGIKAEGRDFLQEMCKIQCAFDVETKGKLSWTLRLDTVRRIISLGMRNGFRTNSGGTNPASLLVVTHVGGKAHRVV